MRLIAGLATLLSLLCLASDASAHATLVATAPSDGSVVAQAPKMVQLLFNEPVSPGAIKLIDADGRTRDDATVRITDKTSLSALPENLPRGTQVISYRVISEDGHPVAGSIMFSIGAVTGTMAAPTKFSSAAGLIWLARIGVYLGLFIGVGGVFFAAWIAAPRTGSNVIVAALAVGLFSVAASLGLQGLDLLDLPLSDIATPAPWQAAAATSLGPSLAVAVAAMAIAFMAQRSASEGLARALSAMAMAGVGLSLAASGHAATAPPQWLARQAVFLHGIAAAYWAGALVPLLAMTWRPAEGLLAVLYRFSRAAVVAVGLLGLTGLVLAIVQLESFGALIETQYGLILSIKLVLVAALLGLAARNRFRLTPALAGDPLQARPLLRSILIECALVMAILAVVAGWRFTPPPRALAAAAGTPLAIHIHTEQAMFQVLVSPGRVGTDNFVLQLMNGDGSLLTAKEATLTLSLPERGIEPFERKATLGADGYWHVRGVPIPHSGRWRVRIEALVTDFEKITLEDEFDVPAP